MDAGSDEVKSPGKDGTQVRRAVEQESGKTSLPESLGTRRRL